MNLISKIKQIVALIVSFFTGDGRGGLIEEKEQKKEENLEKLRDFLRGKEQIANDEVESLLGVSDATATRYLEQLENEGFLEQVGQTGQGVYYRVK